MKKSLFQIGWNGNIIIYDPISGIINEDNDLNLKPLEGDAPETLPPYFQQPIDLQTDFFKPICLTVYLNHNCNLSCKYCYISGKENLPQSNIDIGAVRSAAEIVAENCREKKRPFILGFHGGNEPLLNPEHIEKCIKICQETAGHYNIKFRPFCTTNGVIPEKTAEWAAAQTGLTTAQIIHSIVSGFPGTDCRMFMTSYG